jgi:hypothetical protein
MITSGFYRTLTLFSSLVYYRHAMQRNYVFSLLFVFLQMGKNPMWNVETSGKAAGTSSFVSPIFSPTLQL